MIGKTLTIFICAIVFMGCTEDSVKEISIPVLVTGEPANISEQSITLSASIIKNNEPALSTGFVLMYSAKPEPYIPELFYSDSISNDAFFTTLRQDRLESNKVYYARSYAKFNGQNIYGNEVKFTSLAGERIIDSVVPMYCKAYDVVEIHGQNFAPGFTKVRFALWNGNANSYALRIISVSKNTIVAEIPQTYGTWGLMDLTVITTLYNGIEEGVVKEDVLYLN